MESIRRTDTSTRTPLCVSCATAGGNPGCSVRHDSAETYQIIPHGAMPDHSLQIRFGTSDRPSSGTSFDRPICQRLKNFSSGSKCNCRTRAMKATRIGAATLAGSSSAVKSRCRSPTASLFMIDPARNGRRFSGPARFIHHAVLQTGQSTGPGVSVMPQSRSDMHLTCTADSGKFLERFFVAVFGFPHLPNEHTPEPGMKKAGAEIGSFS